MERQIDLLSYKILVSRQEEQYSVHSRELVGESPPVRINFINLSVAAPGLSHQGQAGKEARTPGQNFKVRIFLALRYDQLVDTIKFIENIKDDEL